MKTTLISLLATLLILETLNAQAESRSSNPCEDSVYLALKSKLPVGLSEDELTYFIEKDKECAGLIPGEPPPDLTLPDLDGNLVSLSDFRGTVVYLEFWGTWCKPCIDNIPLHLELRKRLRNKNVAFVFVALESNNLDGLKKLLKKREFSGIHLYAEGQAGNEEVQKYRINMVPTDVLIDQEGNLVSSFTKGPDKIEPDILELLEVN